MASIAFITFSYRLPEIRITVKNAAFSLVRLVLRRVAQANITDL